MKEILITNDDGFDSIGLKALIEALKPLGNITVVAPAREKSACGHSLTLTRPLEFIEVDKNFYKLEDGTPTDCIFLSLNKMFVDKKPDIVISGINVGANLGEDITYSGTASASMEAVLQGIPSIAISQVYNTDSIDKFGYELAKEAIYDLVKKIFEDKFPLPPRRFLNVNIPPISKDKSKGFKITKVGEKHYDTDAMRFDNPRGREFFWIGLPSLHWANNQSSDSDFMAIADGYISITPIMLDMTSHSDIERLKDWI
jgi:5'-nucleotidase